MKHRGDGHTYTTTTTTTTTAAAAAPLLTCEHDEKAYPQTPYIRGEWVTRVTAIGYLR